MIIRIISNSVKIDSFSAPAQYLRCKIQTNDEDIIWLNSITCLKNCNMDIQEMSHQSGWCWTEITVILDAKRWTKIENDCRCHCLYGADTSVLWPCGSRPILPSQADSGISRKTLVVPEYYQGNWLAFCTLYILLLYTVYITRYDYACTNNSAVSRS